MTDRRSIKEIINDWLRDHPTRRSKPKPLGKSIYFELQLVIILFAVFSLYHYPQMTGLPHADVLILDMTHTQHDSRNLLLSLLDRAHLSWQVYDSFSINMFRLIPTGNYRFIILWGHSGLNDMAITEPYSPFHHVLEQLTGQVGNYLVQGKEYFSIGPGLVESMQGRLPGSLVLLMGCNTLTQPELARAFIKKGASVVVGWSGLVSLAVTDTFVISLFDRTLQQHKPLDQALIDASGVLASIGIENELTTIGLGQS